jgi:hypothetical protein
MDQRITPLAGQFTVGTNLVRRALADVDEAALYRQPGPHSNPMLWMAGHLTQFRARIVRVLGSERPVPWEELFRTGSRLHEPSAYPRITEIEALWGELSEELIGRLEALTAAELDATPRVRVPSTDGTVAGALALFAFHEGYHVGQLGYLRRWLDYSSLFEDDGAAAARGKP